MWAARNGHAAVVEMLLDANAGTVQRDQVRRLPSGWHDARR